MTRGRVAFSVNTSRCKRCQICLELCPGKLLRERDDGYPEAVAPGHQCAQCELLCPDQAISLVVVGGPEAKDHGR